MDRPLYLCVVYLKLPSFTIMVHSPESSHIICLCMHEITHLNDDLSLCAPFYYRRLNNCEARCLWVSLAPWKCNSSSLPAEPYLTAQNVNSCHESLVMLASVLSVCC